MEDTSNSRNKILMAVIIALLVLLLLAIGFVGFMVFRMNANEGQDVLGAAAVGLRPEELTLIELSAPVSTNIRGETGGAHIIRASFIVAVDNTERRASQDLIDLLLVSDSIMRSTALHVVRTRTFQELSHPDAMALLEYDVLEQLRLEFGSNLIHRVIIGDWFLD